MAHWAGLLITSGLQSRLFVVPGPSYIALTVNPSLLEETECGAQLGIGWPAVQILG